MARREHSKERGDACQQQPPARTRFRPGQSGNPGGRPKRDRDFGKLINAELDAVVTVTENGKKVKLTKRELGAKSLANEVAKGNLKAIDAAVRYGWLAAGADHKLVEVDPQLIASFLARNPAPIEPTPDERASGDEA